MLKVTIQVNNQRSRVVGDLPTVYKLRDALRIKDPKAYWSPAKQSGRWDGFVQYITEAGTFETGLLHQVINKLDEWKICWEIDDRRETFKDLHEVKELGGLVFRGYQADSVKALLNNKVFGIKYPRGILHEATNAGKNLIAAGVFASFSLKRRGLFLIDNKVIYQQALRELDQLLPDQIGRCDSDKVEFNRVTVCMVQTLAIRVKKFPKIRAELAKQDIIIVDEFDTTSFRKDFKTIIQYCFDAPIRVGVSGTAFGHWAKERIKSQNLLKFFGPILHVTTNKDLIEQGVSTPPVIKFFTGNQKENPLWNFTEEYLRAVVKNKKRNRKVWKRVANAIKRDRVPVLIVIRLHEHIKTLLEVCPKEISRDYTIEYVHHKTGGREHIFDNFNSGKTNILIASMIIKRGLNLKAIHTLINAGAGDSWRNVAQILGRGLRKSDTKEKVYIEDFFDQGNYLRKHSKHRLQEYHRQKLEVQEIYKKKLTKKTIK